MRLSAITWKLDVGLKERTSIKIGGTAPFFVGASSVDTLRQIMVEHKGDCYFLGGGSNLLISGGRLKKPVVALGEEFAYITQDKDGSVEVGAGTPFSRVMAFCCQHGLSGVEGLAGIPGQIGGMLVSNAQAFDTAISDNLVRLEAVDKNGKVIVLKKKDIKWGYRSSSAASFFITRAWFEFGASAEVKAKIAQILRKRLAAQDYDHPSCGCVFKNPPEASAGRLIDQCGLKGSRRGGALISDKHANFIVNAGNASYDDVDYLIKLVKDKVFERFGVTLEEEIKRWV